jgi:hypothetical protein
MAVSEHVFLRLYNMNGQATIRICQYAAGGGILYGEFAKNRSFRRIVSGCVQGRGVSSKKNDFPAEIALQKQKGEGLRLRPFLNHFAAENQKNNFSE